ncbi:hypothetical protein HZH68_006205 [Vespula germanica]|uniref:Uncharacterized protein n=1 Tax=Vespula germanica TaxID=30212 RepID=A0A834KGA8_VESGE|nr:hypothetical protein HZH68_006205 [Vespula germanica]
MVLKEEDEAATQKKFMGIRFSRISRDRTAVLRIRISVNTLFLMIQSREGVRFSKDQRLLRYDDVIELQDPLLFLVYGLFAILDAVTSAHGVSSLHIITDFQEFHELQYSSLNIPVLYALRYVYVSLSHFHNKGIIESKA